MLTPILERAILNGWATFRIYNHAFSNFGRIIIPDNSTVIITHVKWFPFFNPAWNNERTSTMTWREFFKYNEFQLKIESKKGTNYLINRNEFDFMWTNNNTIDLNSLVNTDTVKKNLLIMQRRPITTHVYFKCTEYVKLTLQRNSYVEKLTNTIGVLNPSTDEKTPPTGLQGVSILLNTKMQSFSGQTQDYVMGSYKDANITAIPNQQTMQANYMQGFANPDSIFSDLGNGQPYQTHPLVEFGYVVINNNHWDQLQNI